MYHIRILQCQRKGGYQPDNSPIYLWSCMFFGIYTQEKHDARRAHVASRATARRTTGASCEIESGTAGRWLQTKTDTDPGCHAMGWLRLVGSLKLQVSFAKEPYKKDNILQKKTYNFKEPTDRNHPIGRLCELDTHQNVDFVLMTH